MGNTQELLERLNMGFRNSNEQQLMQAPNTIMNKDKDMESENESISDKNENSKHSTIHFMVNKVKAPVTETKLVEVSEVGQMCASKQGLYNGLVFNG